MRFSAYYVNIGDAEIPFPQDFKAVAGNAQGAVADLPATVKRKSQGNPLAAGLVAFGAGLLVSSLIPASSRERQAAVDLKERAEPLTQKVQEAAKEVAGNLREPAQQAAASLKDRLRGFLATFSAFVT